MARQLLHSFRMPTLICISIHLASSSSGDHRATLVSRAEKSSSTLTVVGAHTVVAPSQARIRRRWTGLRLSYAIGVAKPLSLFVETYGSECGKLSAEYITNV